MVVWFGWLGTGYTLKEVVWAGQGRAGRGEVGRGRGYANKNYSMIAKKEPCTPAHTHTYCPNINDTERNLFGGEGKKLIGSLVLCDVRTMGKACGIGKKENK